MIDMAKKMDGNSEQNEAKNEVKKRFVEVVNKNGFSTAFRKLGISEGIIRKINEGISEEETRVKRELSLSQEQKNQLNREFRKAIENGDERSKLEKLVTMGADINAADVNGVTPLFEAVYACNPAALNYLVDKGADVNVKSRNGETLLHRAAERGDFESLKRLIGEGLDVNAKDGDERTPLSHAVFIGYSNLHNFNAIDLLMSNGAELDVKDKFGETPLHWAALNGLKPVKHLVEVHNADVNVKTDEGKTLLHIAAERADELDEESSLEFVRYLITEGVNVNAKTKNGRTALDCLYRHAGPSFVILASRIQKVLETAMKQNKR